ncbi:MAG TPA: protein kinase, partial [Thermoanaerobaculia bacterium]
MASKSRPYEQFGTYILFRKLESDALGELWRAGRIEGEQLGATVAIRRLTGGRREALVAAAHGARQIVPQLNGTSFVRNQTIDVINGIPYIAHEYAGGRSLRHIVDRARGGAGLTPNPIPIDQAIVIAEKVALSIATTNDLRHGGDRLMHGALIPQFIWISDDGEIRVAGQQLGRGVIESLADPKVANELARYFSPEYQATGTPSKSTDVYSMGAILFLLITGQEPPDAANASAFTHAVGAAKTMSGVPVPDDIRAVLLKSFVLDPAARYGSIAEMKTELSALAHGGKYSATTFNLAFYLSNLLKKEMEGETIDREREAKVNVAPYLEPQAAVAASAPVAAAVPSFGAEETPRKKNKVAIFAMAAGFVAIAAGSAVVFMGKKPVPAAKAG